MKLVVVESHFGNTVAVGEAMAAALCANGIPAAVRLAHEATSTLPAGVDTLVVGAPTHNGALSTPATRSRAAGIGAKDSTDLQGVREWLGALEAVGTNLVVFDTVRAGEDASRSAADEAVDLAAGGAYASVTRGLSFGVGGVAGPLSPGELVRARRWALGGFAMDDVS
ncbi:hypothetical protein ASG56_20840 [Rhodococcus sp. Leaf7]|uniref:flavodoxin family protein n=1 Tax=unclassified Rhodococcus (in: high G+C Gram-positive bacteria) TaxID=192944 RepID=UPI0006FD5534|nr:MULTISPECIES: flavodoxin family protein [unclassified Rhodococcus (in: high G+C Gram-positive bacteria)]KQU01966.1 hypothetical protein ASG56_20840 [Rhodococcus sp. Leaf7]KQU38259.1 hypothetical protein ASG64_20810 [Rhodococcus sp. Leaf247]